MPLVIILNGPSSAGKSALARALQAEARRPLLHVEMDAFLAMLPESLQDHAETFRYRSDGPPNAPRVEIDTGPTGARLLQAIWAAAGALAGTGFDLVLDMVLTGWRPPDLAAAFPGHRVVLVRVTAPLAVLAAREAARPDRMPGMARAQLGLVDRGLAYDATADTADETPAELARSLAARFGL